MDYYKDDKGGKKRKLNKGTSFEEMINNSNAIEARAARGEIQLAGPIEATKRKDTAIARMTGPAPCHGHKAQLIFAIQSLGKGQVEPDPEAPKWIVKGLSTSLFSHQITGLSMMLGKEFSPKMGPKGGVLADEMGLGKTLQTIAMMRLNRPTKADRKKRRRTTLIVAPASAIRQWMSEIRKHVALPKEEENPTFDIDNLDDDDDEEEDEGRTTGFEVVTHYKWSKVFKDDDDVWRNADVV